MSTAPTPDSLTSVLQATASALDVDIEEVTVSTAGRRRVLRIAVDKDGGVTLDDVADATRRFSDTLDADDVMGEQPYTLEVSSPGLDRPLTAPRHWRRNVGRLVKVTDGEGSPLVGRIVSCDDEQAALDVDGSERSVRFADLTSARVQVEFKRLEG